MKQIDHKSPEGPTFGSKVCQVHKRMGFCIAFSWRIIRKIPQREGQKFQNDTCHHTIGLDPENHLVKRFPWRCIAAIVELNRVRQWRSAMHSWTIDDPDAITASTNICVALSWLRSTSPCPYCKLDSTLNCSEFPWLQGLIIGILSQC